MSDWNEAYFSVDAALLAELGERLVGKPSVALAELVKNAHDADATDVLIELSQSGAEVTDNGHGMDEAAFRAFWMRVGSTHKTRLRVSRRFHRPMTGSKGVGRLSVQFLARELELRTVSADDQEIELVAKIKWDEAIAVGADLTSVSVRWRMEPRTSIFPADPDGNTCHGTRLILRHLRQRWGNEEIRALAQEVWTLRPPFLVAGGDADEQGNVRFDVRLSAGDDLVEAFDEQLNAILKIWYARVQGRVRREGARSVLDLVLTFHDDEQHRESIGLDDFPLSRLRYEVRVFKLQDRQPRGIKVGDAREYLNRFGGVRIYDAGFLLPFYGLKESDWLEIEQDHSHRLQQSRLLPEALRREGGMTFLPTTSRLLGAVHVETSAEARAYPNNADARLAISITRDRLVSNTAFAELRRAVRLSLDFYAVTESRRQHTRGQSSKPVVPAIRQLEVVEKILEQHGDEIPEPTRKELSKSFREMSVAVEIETVQVRERSALLGSLASAGMAALALEHEERRQFGRLTAVARRLRDISSDSDHERELVALANELETWVERMKRNRRIFSHLADEDEREQVHRFHAHTLVRGVVDEIEPFLGRVSINTTGVPTEMLLPPATRPEWGSVFQNVFINASNALVEIPQPRIVVRGGRRRRDQWITVEDNGSGVDLVTSEQLFEPFVRRSKISSSRRSLGLGGTGLGLTIVRMIAESRDAKVEFVAPSDSFATALRLSWREQ